MTETRFPHVFRNTDFRISSLSLYANTSVESNFDSLLQSCSSCGHFVFSFSLSFFLNMFFSNWLFIARWPIPSLPCCVALSIPVLHTLLDKAFPPCIFLVCLCLKRDSLASQHYHSWRQPVASPRMTDGKTHSHQRPSSSCPLPIKGKTAGVSLPKSNRLRPYQVSTQVYYSLQRRTRLLLASQ